MPPRGAAKAASPVSGSLSDRFGEALRRTLPKLPGDMQEDFAALISPESLAITIGVFVAWAGSHAFGVGEIVDVGLVALGLLTLGTMAFDVGEHITKFLGLVINAKTTKDLDDAADHLAHAVSLLGVTLFAMLVTKRAGKVVARAAPRHFGLTAEEWLYKLGRRRIAPLQRQRAAEALAFFEKKNVTTGTVEDWLKAMDLSKNVSVKTIASGQEIVGYMQVKPGALARIRANPDQAATILASLTDGDLTLGRFFTTRGTSMSRLGIGTQNRVFCRFRIEGSVEVLESVPVATNDTWTAPATKRVVTSSGTAHDVAVKQMVGGGGTQYILPDSRTLFRSGRLKLISLGGTTGR